ncbi:NAD(P)-binding protein [Rhizodiscina lignyota]|uniref:NAD(P)-binding protein n=1 Tax=Rhizodiscina lignyota TaxID=1504668 RepID=A0A9P4IQ66_9PEZI|nr:NAD(P)-binding protein [Rhizodiscina lignyota]
MTGCSPLLLLMSGYLSVYTGGATGIGAATVRILANAGANVIFGDVNKDAAEKLTSELNSKDVTFLPTDVTNYADNLKLFRTAIDKYGRVDHGIPCAGIIEKGKWFDPTLTIDSKELEQPETEAVIRVNLIGVLYFTRIATVFLRHNKKSGEDKSVCLIASAAGFRESPGLPTYQATKHAVLGLMRSLRKVIYPREGTRINAVCPGVTDTDMTAAIINDFRKSGQAINSADDVAKVVVGLLTKDDWNGKAVYVEDSNGWEIEDGIVRTMPDWLGKEPTERMMRHLKQISSGAAWEIK